jgi:hypothetical protein
MEFVCAGSGCIFGEGGYLDLREKVKKEIRNEELFNSYRSPDTIKKTPRKTVWASER